MLLCEPTASVQSGLLAQRRREVELPGLLSLPLNLTFSQGSHPCPWLSNPASHPSPCLLVTLPDPEGWAHGIQSDLKLEQLQFVNQVKERKGYKNKQANKQKPPKIKVKKLTWNDLVLRNALKNIEWMDSSYHDFIWKLIHVALKVTSSFLHQWPSGLLSSWFPVSGSGSSEEMDGVFGNAYSDSLTWLKHWLLCVAPWQFFLLVFPGFYFDRSHTTCELTHMSSSFFLIKCVFLHSSHVWSPSFVQH